MAVKDPARIVRIVLNGLKGPVTVNGREFGQNSMVAFGPQLNDTDVAAVLTHVRSNWGNQAPPVKPKAVAKIREATRDRRDAAGENWLPWTASELLQIPLAE